MEYDDDVELELELAKVERPKESETADGYYSLESLCIPAKSVTKKNNQPTTIDDKNNTKKSTE